MENTSKMVGEIGCLVFYYFINDNLANMTNLTPEEEAVVEKIATELNENHRPALEQIKRIVERLGIEQAENYLQQTLEIEAQEGILTTDKTRRRSPGGAYLYLVRREISGRDRRYIWPQLKKKNKKIKPAFPWDDRIGHLNSVLKAAKGELRTVKITLTGRPGKVVERGNVVLTIMKSKKEPPALPKGLPLPPQESTNYVVYIATKQWKRVEPALDDPDDILIVEGYPVFDQKLGAMAVFAMNTTTRVLQSARREEQKQQAGQE